MQTPCPAFFIPALWRVGNISRLEDLDPGRATTLVSLGGDDLVIVSAELEASIRPGVEMVLHGDCPTDPLLLADGPELIERRL